MNVECVTLDEVLAAGAVRGASLVPESSGYLTLAISDAISRLPLRVDSSAVAITTEGSVTVTRQGEVLAARDAARHMREILRRLLSVSTGSMPGLSATASPRPESDRGIEGFVAELEAALVPVNRSAGRRVLARLARETARAKQAGRLKLAAQVPARVAPAPLPAAPAVVAPAPLPAAPAVVAPAPEPAAPPRVAPAPEPSVPVVLAPAPEPSVPVVLAPAPEPSVPVVLAPAPEPSVPVVLAPAVELSVPIVFTPAPEPSVPVVFALAPEPEPSPGATDIDGPMRFVEETSVTDGPADSMTEVDAPVEFAFQQAPVAELREATPTAPELPCVAEQMPVGDDVPEPQDGLDQSCSAGFDPDCMMEELPTELGTDDIAPLLDGITTPAERSAMAAELAPADPPAFTPVDVLVQFTPAWPPVQLTPGDAAVAVELTPAGPPAQLTPAAPVAESMPAAPAVQFTPAGPIVSFTPAAPAVQFTPAVPAVQFTPAGPPVQMIAVDPPASLTPAAPSAHTPVGSIAHLTPTGTTLPWPVGLGTSQPGIRHETLDIAESSASSDASVPCAAAVAVGSESSAPELDASEPSNSGADILELSLEPEPSVEAAEVMELSLEPEPVAEAAEVMELSLEPEPVAEVAEVMELSLEPEPVAEVAEVMELSLEPEPVAEVAEVMELSLEPEPVAEVAEVMELSLEPEPSVEAAQSASPPAAAEPAAESPAPEPSAAQAEPAPAAVSRVDELLASFAASSHTDFRATAAGLKRLAGLDATVTPPPAVAYALLHGDVEGRASVPISAVPAPIVPVKAAPPVSRRRRGLAGAIKLLFAFVVAALAGAMLVWHVLSLISPAETPRASEALPGASHGAPCPQGAACAALAGTP